MEKGLELRNYFGIWKRLAVRDSAKVPFRERWKMNDPYWQYYAVISYACISSALVFKTEAS